jgi:hypothetical protein
VYVILNPAWPGYVKLGCAADLKARLNVYQTGSPHRDYVIHCAAPFMDYRAAELVMKDQLRGHRQGNTEWYRLHPQDARNHLHRLAKQEYYQ